MSSEISFDDILKAADRGLANNVHDGESDQIGIFLTISMKRSELNIQTLSDYSGVCVDDIKALKLGVVHTWEAVQIMNNLKPYLNFDEQQYNEIIIESSKRKV